MPDRAPFCGARNGICGPAADNVWRAHLAAAAEAYDTSATCNFTSFNAYEWTATPGGARANYDKNIALH